MDINIIKDYIKPELAVLIPVLLALGWAIKYCKKVKNEYIPLLLVAIGVFLATLWVLAMSPLNGWQDVLLAIFTAIVQGALCAAGSVLSHQIYKQQQNLKQNLKQ